MALLDQRDVLGVRVAPRQHEIEHAPRDRRGRLGAETGVLHDDGQCDLRVVDRREGGVERMVAQVVGHLALVVLLVLANADRLRRPGLPTTRVARPHEDARRGAFLRHAVQRLADHLHVIGLQRQRTQRLGRHQSGLPGCHILDLAHQPRHIALPARYQRGGGGGELQHREVVVALADAERDGLAGVPLLQLRLLVVLALPLGRGQHAGDLAVDVDAGAAAEAEGLELLVDQVHAHVGGQLVVVDVARLDDRAVHVHHAQPAVTVAAEAVVAEHEDAVVVGGLLRRALAGFQRGDRHEGLEGRAGRVGAAQGAVQQGLVDRLVELLPALRIDAVDEQVGVEGRLADEGQHLAGARVDRDQRAAPVAEQLLDHRLQLDVDRQPHRVARRRRAGPQAPHRAARGAGLDLLEAGDAVQLGLVLLLDAELADVVGALVVGRIVGLVDRVLLGLVDAADVAQHMAAELAIGVVAEQPRLDVDPGEAETLRGETRHLLVAELGADRQGLEALGVVHHALEAATVARRDVDHFLQRIDGALQVVDLRRRELQRVGRVVVRQHDAVAVEDQAAVRRDRQYRDAVALGARGQLVVPQHLQRDQARRHQPEAEQHQRAGGDQAQPEAAQLLVDVLEFGHGPVRRCRAAVTAVDSRPGPAHGAAAPAAARRPPATATLR
ncbi:hypothetical protein X551_01244 [Methylibium sp. T29]|nr:hypothetical protein X551_01244 [Methylibium sp. T29]EWS60140.1 hypothetical protein Y694_02042 [Methylibium sp. T29-B]